MTRNFALKNIVKKLSDVTGFNSFCPQNHDFELKYLPSIAVLHLPSAIGNGLNFIAVGNAVAVACIRKTLGMVIFKQTVCNKK